MVYLYLLKTKDTWQLQLMSLFTLGTDEDTFAGADNEKGLSYQDYLRLLLTLRKPEVLALRALDLIERNLTFNGKSFVKVDQLFCALKRTIYTVPINEVIGKGRCKRCG